MTKNLKNIFPVLGVILLGIISALWHDTGEAIITHVQLVLLAFAQNISFSVISRARNRNSDNYHLIAAVFSNGVWFLTFQHLVINNMTLSMVLPFIAGTTLGSLFGAAISKSIENILGLTADATKTSSEKNPEKSFLQKYGLFVLLGLCGVVSFLLTESMDLVATILGLAYVNHIMMGLSSRAKNRGSYNYLILTTVASWFIWFLTFGFLIKNEMNFALFVPYTVATVLGSITGARASMRIERFFGFKPDVNLSVSTEYKSLSGFIRNWRLLLSILLICVLYVFCQKSQFGQFLGIPSTNMTVLMLLFGTLIYGSQSMTYIISSRASNRSNMLYHLCGRLVNGLVTFFTYKYMVGFKASPDIFAPILAGSTLGNVFGQQIGIKIETKIGALMDDATETQKKSA